MMSNPTNQHLMMQTLTMKRNKSQKDPYITLGKIGKPKGLKGEFFVTPYTDSIENFINYKSFTLFEFGEPMIVNFEYLKLVNTKIVGKACNFNTREDAEKFKNAELYFPKSDLPKLDGNDAYWYELIGMEVINLDQQSLGKIHRIDNYGSNDVLETHSSEKIHLIPFIKNRIIIDIDRESNKIIVDWEREY